MSDTKHTPDHSDARLIAASPDLLAALLYLRRPFARLLPTGENS